MVFGPRWFHFRQGHEVLAIRPAPAILPWGGGQALTFLSAWWGKSRRPGTGECSAPGLRADHGMACWLLAAGPQAPDGGFCGGSECKHLGFTVP